METTTISANFSESPRNLLENLQLSEIKHIYNTLYTVQHVFPTASVIFANVLIIRSWEKDFITFVFLWPTTISPRNASLGSSLRRKMVKAYSVIIIHYR